MRAMQPASTRGGTGAAAAPPPRRSASLALLASSLLLLSFVGTDDAVVVVVAFGGARRSFRSSPSSSLLPPSLTFSPPRSSRRGWRTVGSSGRGNHAVSMRCRGCGSRDGGAGGGAFLRRPGDVRLRASSAGDDGDDGRRTITRSIESWLSKNLPTVSPADLANYSSRLYERGCRAVSEEELKSSLGREGEEGLDFMKKGHRRALLRKIGSGRSGGESGGIGGDGSEREGGKSAVVAKESATIEGDEDGDDDDDAKLEGDEAGAAASAEERERNLDGLAKGEEEAEEQEEECAGEECWDITRDARFARRTSRSLATTLPPTNSGTTKGGGEAAQGDESSDDECVGEDCWDITRDARFARRTSRSLATTLPPKGGDEYYDITQNSFPEGRDGERALYRSVAGRLRPQNGGDAVPDPRAPSSSRSAFKEEDKSEMSSASALYRKFRSLSTATPSRTGKHDDGGNEKAEKKDAYYDITQSLFPERRSSFGEGEKSEMNSRRPAPKDNLPRWAGAGKTRGKTLTNATPSINADEKSEAKGRSSRSPSGSAPLRSKTKSTLTNATPSIRVDDNAALFDIKSRPTNAGTSRKAGTKPGSYEEGRKRYDDGFREGVDVTKRFPEERPTLSVNTGTKKARTTSGSYEESKRRRSTDEAERNADRSYVDITQQHFPEDRASFVLRVNSGTKKRGTTAGSYEEAGVVRNVAHNFSRDSASLHGHPRTKRAVRAAPPEEEECDDDDICLDTNQFSSDLAPPSPKVAASSNAVWRADSSAVKHEKYKDDADFAPDDGTLPDTPRAFAKNLDMVPPSRVRVTEADKFLDTNQFSWNLSPSSQMGAMTGGRDQQFLDTPRAFRSDVEMRSSNMSGSRFKRSSDIPPELKGARDYYDITTAPMSSVDDMAGAKVTGESRRKGGSRGGGGGGEHFDVTRASFSKLERTSSAVRDANSASRARSRGEEDDPSNSAPSSDDDEDGREEESSYEEVMHWILTNLPDLQEDDAIAYFHCLLEDGFDSVGMLGEILEADLRFMKRGHRRALLRNIGVGAEEDGVASSTEDLDPPETETSAAGEGIESPETPDDDAVGRTKAELDDLEAWIAEQNRLVEERLAARLALEKEAAEGAVSSKQDDEFEDITRSSFVEGSSASSSASRSENRKRTVPSIDDGVGDEQEEVFDITREAFADRPSLAAAPGHHETPAARERSDGKSGETNASLPRSGGESPKEDIPEPPPPEQPSGEVEGAVAAAAPRAELYQYYVKERGLDAARAQRLKEYYTTWTNDAKSHELKFTCVFTCPLTGEHFACGSWGASGGEAVDVVEDRVYWYKNKKQAMNAAAARALDCFRLRECHGTENAPPAGRLCRDAPYPSEEDAPALPIPPVGVDLPTTLVRLEDAASESTRED